MTTIRNQRCVIVSTFSWICVKISQIKSKEINKEEKKAENARPVFLGRSADRAQMADLSMRV
jgi:hypothetical protein